MSPYGTTETYSVHAGEVCDPTHCRRSDLSVGSQPLSGHGAEGSRRSAHDPTRTFRQSSLVSGGTVQQAVALIGHTEVNVYPLPADIRRLINREIFSAGSSHRGPCCRTPRAIGLGHRSRLCRRGFERGDAPKASRIKMKAPRMMMNPTARSTMVISLRPCVSPRNP